MKQPVHLNLCIYKNQYVKLNCVTANTGSGSNPLICPLTSSRKNPKERNMAPAKYTLTFISYSEIIKNLRQDK